MHHVDILLDPYGFRFRFIQMPAATRAGWPSQPNKTEFAATENNSASRRSERESATAGTATNAGLRTRYAWGNDKFNRTSIECFEGAILLLEQPALYHYSLRSLEY